MSQSTVRVLDYLCGLDNVKIKETQATATKLEELFNSGAKELMVISDFDKTLTKFKTADGHKTWTSHQVLSQLVKQRNPQLQGKIAALAEKFLPIEYSTELSVEEKIPQMVQWWSGTQSFIVEAGFHREEIRQYVKGSRLPLRDHTENFIKNLSSAHIPLLVFSAGVADVIDHKFFWTFGAAKDNVSIIGNQMLYDSEGFVVNFSDPLIHTFNKSVSALDKKSDIFTTLSTRSSLLLLGDNVADANMSHGLDDLKTALKIGFLNCEVESNLDLYMSNFDIVLLEDETMTVPKLIIDEIIGRDKKPE